MSHARAARKCPKCRSAILDPVAYEDVELDVCVRCGGLWFDAGELAELMRSHDPDAAPPGPVAEWISGAHDHSTKVCPACRVRLESHQLRDEDPVPVEMCPRCSGGWLAAGALALCQAGHQLPEARAAIDADRSWGTWLFEFLAGLPVEFNLRPRRTPVVTFALIVINGIIFHVMRFWPFFDLDFIMRLPVNPLELGEPWWYLTLLTSQFLHGNLLHLLGNMYFLWILGDNVEDLLGRARFLAFYLAAGIAAGVAYSVMLSPLDQPAIGASGAISGLLGFYAVLFRRSKLTFMLVFWQLKLTVPIYVAIWAAINLAALWFNLPGVAWEAHLGGLAFGLILGAVSYRRLLRGRPLLRLLNGKVRPVLESVSGAGTRG